MFEVGSKVKLINDHGKNIQAVVGATGMIVDGKTVFPSMYSDLRIRIGSRDINHFIWLLWDKSNNKWNNQKDGAYLRDRFEPYEKEDLSKLKNNDGRSTCFKCNKKTKRIESISGFYDYCKDCKL